MKSDICVCGFADSDSGDFADFYQSANKECQDGCPEDAKCEYGLCRCPSSMDSGYGTCFFDEQDQFIER